MDDVAPLDPADEGRVIDVDAVAVLRFERSLDAAPDAVWAAITDADATAAWAFRMSLEPRVGGAVTFDTGGEPASGDVLGYDEGRVLEYAWGGPGGRWHVCFMVDADGAGTALTFDHLAPDPRDPDFAAGWHWHLDRLAQHLAGERPAEVFSDEHFEELQRLYARGEG
ncbi:SRPBCC domain-containing protein [Demequina sp. NBRC 110056]|uniref:SRPBCC domain-containing protein n=1 Tax=Demequina sp. NBRC 110056 TaxID=1570345 RepID=UPI00135660AF|nr:SRPBCC domain-containing protein [Demequina sp. NBRC 110056]